MADMFFALAKCGLQIYDRNQGAFNDPNFNRNNCGQTCGGSYEGTTMFFCEKGEVCCPSGPSDQSCSKTCGPYHSRGNHTNLSILGLHSVKSLIATIVITFIMNSRSEISVNNLF